MSKVEAIFRATPKRGKLIFDNLLDLESYLLENEGIDLTVEIRQTAKTSEKMKMYNYLFGVVMNSAVKGFARLGYAGIDKVAARYKLQAEFCKADIINESTGEIETYLLDLSKMSKARLLKFLQDCILFIETELQERVPDSEEYKQMKLKK